jgi:thymidylate synthase ThyX
VATLRRVMYFNEEFSVGERARLAPYFTNLDRPVFGVVNLPEAVKGALFARYSRYPGTLRRLFLEEFADELPDAPAIAHRTEGRRASELYDRVFVGFGDDSVAQLGGAHIACEWVSNVLTKILQRPRLGAYLEQSTRYIAYDRPLQRGGYRYYRDPQMGPRYAKAMDELFAIYASLLPRVRSWAAESFPAQTGDSTAAHARAVHAKALDLVRGLLPTASLSHVGIFASGQTYEQLILHLFAHPLAEARHYGEMILGELDATMPSFMARVERADRGGDWQAFLGRRARSGRELAKRLDLDKDPHAPARPSVQLLEVSGTERDAVAATLFESASASESAIQARLAALSDTEIRDLLVELVGERTNRRHRPGRGFEAIRYRFEVVSDYGAFRDLQRHRMLTVQWQALSSSLGADVPEELDQVTGAADDYRRALELSADEHDRLWHEGLVEHAPYALCMAYRVRYVMDMNAREAMHVIELRSGREGHVNYRAIALEMFAQIAGVHPGIAAAMVHVDHFREPRLERLEGLGAYSSS